VPAADRGRYAAFTYNGEGGRALSDGMAHLRALADAGLTHLHLLPTFDIATIVEDPNARVDLDDGFDVLCARNPDVPLDLCNQFGAGTVRDALASLDPETTDVGDTLTAQELMSYVRPIDSFNWGYDPWHYNVPEGSYASSANGGARVREFRAMVQALHEVGLRVVTDVVYNHTNASGVSDKSVLDRVVPGYYHRQNAQNGFVETSTCCANTATEHDMMERLMVESVVHWVKAYKIDAFRFDLMGHHMKRNMQAVRAALDALTLADDGVDGASIYVYGEGWNFGEVQNNVRGENATQFNMAGTGIGTFNDRLRDAARGGGVFDSGDDLRKNQGFLNGLHVAPNALNPANDTTADLLRRATDQIKVGMAGNLKQFRLIRRDGSNVNGLSVPYNGQSTGYCDDPQETINYVSKHDNQTLFDIDAYKAPTGTPSDQRARMSMLGFATVLLGQGVPFLHMGDDLLRSKSMERDSYDSGDWFNAIDWTGTTNNWNVGLPRKDKDEANWVTILGILGDDTVQPSADDIAATAASLRELLRVRASTPLFRLRTASDVQTRLHFENGGPGQQLGLIAGTVTDGTCAGADLDPAIDGLAFFLNADDAAQSFTLAGANGYVLHPVLADATDADPVLAGASFDDGTDTFTIPARSYAVFVVPQAGAQGAGPACNPLN
jgi:pullulanase-type alpha-1,6-glucosidase